MKSQRCFGWKDSAFGSREACAVSEVDSGCRLAARVTGRGSDEDEGGGGRKWLSPGVTGRKRLSAGALSDSDSSLPSSSGQRPLQRRSLLTRIGHAAKFLGTVVSRIPNDKLPGCRCRFQARGVSGRHLYDLTGDGHAPILPVLC